MAVDDERKLNREELWKFYEKAIEGRNTFYAQYLKYMNLYAIFTGALFIAFYSLVNPDNRNGLDLYALVVSLVGLLTSILWLCSVKGYYAWILNWINVVKYYEECLNEGCKVQDSRFVYGLFCESDTKKCFLISPFRYSTQKLTMLFVEITILGWLVVIFLQMQKFMVCFCECCICLSIQLLFFLFAIIMVLLLCFREELKDNVETHYQLKSLGKDENIVCKTFVTSSPPKMQK